MSNVALLYNGVAFAPVQTRQSIVLPYSAETVWAVVSKWGKQASWMGTVEGQPIFSQLLGNETHEHVGVARAFGIGNKLLIEQLTRLDPTEMILNWQLLSHPLNTNPWPSSFVNFKASLQVFPVLIPGGQSFINWSMELLTEQHAVGAMVKAMEDIQKLGLTNLQVYLAAGLRTPVTAPLAPASFHISQMMQPEQTLAAQQQSAGMGHLPVLPQNPIYCPPPGTPMLTPSAVQPVSSALTQTPEQQQQQASQNASLLQAQLAQLGGLGRQQQQQLPGAGASQLKHAPSSNGAPQHQQLYQQQMSLSSDGSQRIMLLNGPRSTNLSGGSASDLLAADRGVRRQLSHAQLADLSKSN